MMVFCFQKNDNHYLEYSLLCVNSSIDLKELIVGFIAKDQVALRCKILPYQSKSKFA